MEEKNNKKCSNKIHKDLDAILFCQECKVYLCNKCSNYHKELFNEHLSYNLNSNKEIFIDLCKENNHGKKLEFYCKNHNQLCCACCITKLVDNGYGQHKDCNVCVIQDVKEEKSNKLKDNLKYLEDISNNLNVSAKELKNLFDKFEDKKEEIKQKIQNVFTKMRCALNEREDELLQEIDNKYDYILGKDDIIKESEKLPDKIKSSLEKGKLIENDWNDNSKLSSLINICINIENHINKINIINSNIEKYKLNNGANFVDFHIDEECFNNYIKEIKSFGKIYEKSELDSLILKNKEEYTKLYNLLSSKIKIAEMKLLYRSSRDGLTLDNLKDKINNKSNLLFLFFTGNTRIFGSFLKSKIEVNHDSYIKDKDAFAFSINNEKIYSILIPEYAIRIHDKYPILIGNTKNYNGFYINSGSIYDGNLLNKPKVYAFQKNNELTENKDKLNEFEIFEIFLN